MRRTDLVLLCCSGRMTRALCVYVYVLIQDDGLNIIISPGVTWSGLEAKGIDVWAPGLKTCVLPQKGHIDNISGYLIPGFCADSCCSTHGLKIK